MIIAVLLAANAAFAQTISIQGQVSDFTDAQISMVCGPDIWNIKRDSTTTVTSGTLAIGNTVTVKCLSTDAQKVPGTAQKKE